MNPRERILLALNHEEPDRIPIDLGGTDSTGIHVHVYKGLRKVLGLPDKPPRIINFLQQRSDVEKEVLEYLHVDVIDVTRALEPNGNQPFIWKYILPNGSNIEMYTKEWKIWKREDMHKYEAEIPSYISISEKEGVYIALINDTPFAKAGKNDYYFWGYLDPNINPLMKAKSISDVKDFEWNSYKVSTRYLEILRKRAEFLYKNTNYALAFVEGCTLHEWAQNIRGWDRWLSDLRIRKPLAEAILDHRMEIVKYNVERYIEVLKNYVQVIGFGDDFGTEEGLQISPQLFKEYYKHRYEEIFNIVKRKSKMFVFFHSCGSIYPIIKDLIDIGIDILNPVQISAKGMDPKMLKREFGEQITFWGGGVDTQHVLPFAKPEEIIEHVKKLIEIFAPRGGFIFAPVHNIQPPTPPENVLAMYRTAYELGKYS